MRGPSPAGWPRSGRGSKRGRRGIGLAALLRRIGRLADPAGPPDLVTPWPDPDPAPSVRLEEGLHGRRPGYPPDGTAARLCFHLEQPSYNTDRLIGVLEQVAGFYTGHKVVLLWDGLSAHWSTKLRAWLDSQRDWLTVERLPAYAPEVNPVEHLWGNLKEVELANLPTTTLAEVADATEQGIQSRLDRAIQRKIAGRGAVVVAADQFDLQRGNRRSASGLSRNGRGVLSQEEARVRFRSYDRTLTKDGCSTYDAKGRNDSLGGSGAMDQAFVGRQIELAFLDARLEAARGGTPHVVLLSGGAGIGKTALLGQFLARTEPGQTVVRASGEDLEAGLAYGVMGQLVRKVKGPLLERLTEPGAEVERSNPLRIGACLVDLLDSLQAQGSVVVVIDDAHWADRESLQALAFALRRLRNDRVLVLLAAREDLVERLPRSLHRLMAGPAATRLRLDGLEVAELRTLSMALGRGPLSMRAAARLHDCTGGNALHARALLEELPTSALRHNGQPLPAPRSFRKLVLSRLAACPTGAKRLVFGAAVLGTHCPLALASRLVEVDDPLPALEQAIHAHLLEERHTASELLVGFPSPLIHAAVYHDLGPVRRRELHARAAKLVSGEAAMVRHRVAAASGPDPRLAAELTDLAGRQAARGLWLAAADTQLAAARLSVSGVERESRVLQAIDHLLVGGSATEAASFTDEIATFDDTARRDYVLARLAMVTSRHSKAELLLARAWEHVDPAAQPDLAAVIAEQLALYKLLRAQGEQTVTWARRAMAITAAAPAVPSNRLDILAMGLLIGGHAPEALELTADLPNRNITRERGDLDGGIGRSIALAWADDLTGARNDLTALLSAYQHQGAPLPWALIGLTILAEIEYRMGAWDDAIAHAELAVALAEDTDQDWLAAFVHAVATFPLAGRGALQRAAAHARAAATHLNNADTEFSIVWVAIAHALVAKAQGDYQHIAAALEPLDRLPAWTAVDAPGWPPWPALYAEALVALGHCDQAEAALVPYETRAAACRQRWALVAAARARGALEATRGHPQSAEAAYQSGLEHPSDALLPFDFALLEAAYGRFLRRTGRRADAVAQLKAARGRLVRLDARPYLARCDQELEACGRTPAGRQQGLRAALTPQELAVARLVAAGRTNRQAAAEMVVSVKTIEYHLSNAYAKLAITSRMQLAIALRQDPEEPLA